LESATCDRRAFSRCSSHTVNPNGGSDSRSVDANPTAGPDCADKHLYGIAYGNADPDPFPYFHTDAKPNAIAYAHSRRTPGQRTAG
jgi:hypothetical protein